MTNSVTFPKKIPFYENFTTQPFSEKIGNLHPETKIYIFLGQFYLKGEGQRFLEHPGLTP